jgi:hypothetical protein
MVVDRYFSINPLQILTNSIDTVPLLLRLSCYTQTNQGWICLFVINPAQGLRKATRLAFDGNAVLFKLHQDLLVQN